jgi:hypothetical protein
LLRKIMHLVSTVGYGTRLWITSRGGWIALRMRKVKGTTDERG